MIFNLFFFFLYTFISKLNCLYNNNEITEVTLNMNQKLNGKSKNLLVGNVYEELLYYSKKYVFNFNKPGNKNINLYFHFYPLDDCHIIISSNDTSLTIKEKSYYNNKLFYAQIISKKVLKPISFNIKPINYLNQDKNSTCHLIINSFNNSNNNIFILNLTEKKPTFLHFDKNLKQIKLFYNLKKEKKPIIFSFFIKDKVKFNVRFGDTKKGLSKTISYIDKFIIKKDFISSNVNNISILITLKEEDKVSDLIVSVIGDSSTFYYLQRNFLNLGFIFSDEETHYYCMEVYKDEEGEIMLHDKRKNGKLVSKIFNEKRLPNINDFKNISDEFADEFDEYSQKLSFNTIDCKNLNNKCYLLITYGYSNCSYNLFNVTGTEYTLLTRIWDKYEFISQIVNIPLNEYVFGNLDEKSVNHHYYTVFIPEDSEDITIEIHGNEIKAYVINGIKKINAISKKDNIYDLEYNNTKGEIIILTKANLNLTSFKNQYISFSFFREDIKLDKISYYYFRVLQPDSINNITFYPLDSNYENLCRPMPELISKYNSCYFLLKNDYNELSHKQTILEMNDNTVYSTKLVLAKKKEDYYSFNLNKHRFNTPLRNNLDIDNTKNYIDKYMIIKILILNYKSLLTISSIFDEVKPSIQIYSYKLFYLGNSINLKLDKNKAQQYKLKIIKNYLNKVEINFKINNETKDNINNNYGKQISYPISKDFDSLEFCRNSDINLFLKFDYKRKRKNVEEIGYGATTKSISKYEEFPVIFYIKNINDKGLDFNILFEGKISNLNITGYLVDFQDITKIDKNKKIIKENLLNYPNSGIYDNEAQTGIIEFNNIDENIKDIENIRDIDTYYIVMISHSNINEMQNNMNLNCRIIIEAYPREDENNMIPSGKYIRGMFDLNKNSKGKIYYIQECDNCRIFFSSNYKNLQIIIDNNNNTDKVVNKSLGYLQIYKIKGIINKFTVKLITNENITNGNIIEGNKTTKKALKNINYILKYENYNPKDKRNISGINITYYEHIESNKGNQRNITISFVYNSNHSFSFSSNYYLRLYKDKDKIEDEDLNTLAITSSEISYFNESLDNNNSQINFTVNNVDNNEVYLGYLTIKSNHYKEIYGVYKFTIDKKKREENNDKKDNSLLSIILIIISFLIIIIIFIILSIFYMRMKKKNKELEEKVNNISFVKKDDDDNDSSDDQGFSYI